MRLTDKQKEAIRIINDYKELYKNNYWIHLNTVNSLVNLGLVYESRYSNGEFIRLTDDGYGMVKYC